PVCLFGCTRSRITSEPCALAARSACDSVRDLRPRSSALFPYTTLFRSEESIEMYTRAGEPKKLVVLKGYGHYEVYKEPAFSEVMQATVAWYREHLPAKRA